MIARRLQAIERKLRRNILRGYIAAALASAAAFEHIAGEKFDVRADALAGNFGHLRGGDQRHSGK